MYKDTDFDYPICCGQEMEFVHTSDFLDGTIRDVFECGKCGGTTTRIIAKDEEE